MNYFSITVGSEKEVATRLSRHTGILQIVWTTNSIYFQEANKRSNVVITIMASSNIQPAMVGGYGCEIERGVRDPSQEGRVGRQFCSPYPRDIQPNTRFYRALWNHR